MAIECYDKNCKYHENNYDEWGGPYCHELKCIHDNDSVEGLWVEYEHFPYTVEGCREAIKYLKYTGNETLIEREASTDGFTAVRLANLLYDRMK